ncbi:MAG TPA: thiol:disulfide interchange protein DsbA/DsbL [Rhodanobacteraceae bacterium]|nr:thiol:disulfide interchange protein DsbA/DsbL [Rhodanobacteraceae bacterium]
MLMRSLCAATLLLFAGHALAAAPQKWVAGKNYTVLEPAQPTPDPDKVEVVEVFSYGCPHCKDFVPFADKIREALPPQAVFHTLPAALGHSAWATFARGYYAARALGVAHEAHDALFKAVFEKQTISPISPTLADLAKFYAGYGVKPDVFTATANSFGVNAAIKRGNERIKGFGVTGTPTIVVNGKYRLDVASAGGFGQTVELVHYLVAKEVAELKAGQ